MLVRFGFPSTVDRFVNNFFHDDLQFDKSFGLSLWTPAVDIAEVEQEYQVKAELPGVSRDDVKITIENNVLTIRGEKKAEKESDGTNVHRVERSYGSFQRSFKLPVTVNAEKIEATFADGILSVTIPKAEEAKPKQIEVKVK